MKFRRSLITLALISISTLHLSAQAKDHNAAVLSPAQTAQVQTVVHDYIIKNPEVVIEAAQNYQEQQYLKAQVKTQAEAVKNASLLFGQANDPFIGNAEGKLSVAEFFDYQCAHCVDMKDVFTNLAKSNPDVRIVYKEFPIRGPVSVLASQAALAAHMQGKYIAMHDALMDAAKSLDENKINELAKNIGLDVDKFKADMKGATVKAQLDANYKLGQNLKIMGTPAIFVAKTQAPTAVQFIPGQVDQKSLEAALAKA